MSTHQFKIKFANLKNNKAVSFIGSLDESVWNFYQYGSFRSEYEVKYFIGKEDFISALNKFMSNPSAVVCSFQVDRNSPMRFTKPQASEAVAELIAKL